MLEAMGDRLTSITTKTGDDGTTGLGDGRRVDKDNPRVEAVGTVDELNSCIGVILSEEVPGHLGDVFSCIQNDLFELGGELALPERPRVTEAMVLALEEELEKQNALLGPLKEFILPGGTMAASQCHVARTVCRRAERCLVTLSKKEEVSPASMIYLNRLSDLLFVMARSLNREAGFKDAYWQPKE